MALMNREEIIDKLIEISKQQAVIVASLATLEAQSGSWAYWVKTPYLCSSDALNLINVAVDVMKDVQ